VGNLSYVGYYIIDTLYTEFEVPILSHVTTRSKNGTGSKNLKTGHVTLTTPSLGACVICRLVQTKFACLKDRNKKASFCKTRNDVIYDVIIWVQDGNCKKMARKNFSIAPFYNITKNQDNPIKTVGRDSLLSPKTPKNTSF